MAAATGLARDTIPAGLRQWEHRRRHPEEATPRRLRRPGTRRKAFTDSDPDLTSALEALVEPLTRGDPQASLRWTCQSTRRLAEELSRQGQRIGHRTAAWLWPEAGYSLQGNRKTREGNRHADRPAQFEFINARAANFQKRRRPVLRVDTNKKEWVGDFGNGGREWNPQGAPERVGVHDFVDPELGKAIP